MIQTSELKIPRLRELMGSERDPDGRAFAPLADALRRAGRHEEALSVVSDGIQRHPDFATGHLVAGRVHRDRRETGEAIAAFERVLELDPENVVALHGLGRMLVVRGELDEAARMLTRATELGYSTDLEGDDPVTVEDVLPAGEGALEAGDETSWETELLDASAALGIHELDTDEEAAEAEEPPAAGTETPAAEEPPVEVAPAAPRDPDEVDVKGPRTRTMAELYVRQGMPEQAIALYRHLVRTSPDDEELRERLEELEHRGDRGSDARPGEVAETSEGGAAAARRTGEALGADAVVPEDDEVEMEAREAAGAGHASATDTPFAWTEGLGIGDAEGTEAVESPTVDIGALAPGAETTADDDVVDMAELAPDATPAPDEVTGIEALAPDDEITLEDDAVDIGALAPGGETAPGEGAVDIGALAPDADRDEGDADGGGEVVDIGALAPEEER